MNPKLLAAALAVAATLAATPTMAITTGVPSGSTSMAYAFDGTDFYAERVSFTAASQVQSISAHVLGGAADETFTVALYDSSGIGGLPGSMLYSGQATFTANGWNGLSGLTGWAVSASSYWVAFEIGASDTLGTGSATGALLDKGAPSPFGATAFNDGSGYRFSSPQPLTFGVMLTDTMAAAVPEPAPWLMLAAGVAALSFMRRRQQR